MANNNMLGLNTAFAWAANTSSGFFCEFTSTPKAVRAMTSTVKAWAELKYNSELIKAVLKGTLF